MREANAQSKRMLVKPMVTVSVESSLSSISEEFTVLYKILYRNKNQHGKTKIYCSLVKLTQLIKIFPDFQKLSALEIGALKVLCSSDSNFELQDVSKIYVDCTKDIFNSVKLGCEIIKWASVAARSLGMQISQQTFVSLYSVSIAAVAKIFRNMAFITTHFDSLLQSMMSKLRQLTVTNPAFEVDIMEVLYQLQLPLELQRVLSTVRSSQERKASKMQNLVNSIASSTVRQQLPAGNGRVTSITVATGSGDEDLGEMLSDNLLPYSQSISLPSSSTNQIQPTVTHASSPVHHCNYTSTSNTSFPSTSCDHAAHSSGGIIRQAQGNHMLGEKRKALDQPVLSPQESDSAVTGTQPVSESRKRFHTQLPLLESSTVQSVTSSEEDDLSDDDIDSIFRVYQFDSL